MSIPNSEICGHGTCVQAKSKLGYTCICENGWRASNVTLACNVDIDECAEMRPHCSNDPKVQCYNTPGSFICGACPAGYTGNGYTCVDVNECEVDNGGCSTSPRVECINTRVWKFIFFLFLLIYIILSIFSLSISFSFFAQIKRVHLAAPTAPSATMAMVEFVYHRLDRIISARTTIRSCAA